MGNITALGYETTPKSEIKSEVEQMFKRALGEDLSLDADTPQGNLIAELTDLLHQIDMQRQTDFYARDIYKAEGIQLDILGRELGLPRRDAIPTQVVVNLQGAINYTVLSGTKAAILSNSSQVFEFTDDVQIVSSTQSVTLVASDKASYEGINPGMQLQCQEYSPQIYSMTVDSVVAGQPVESDYSYRIRLITAKNAGVDEVKHMTLALENVENVLSAYVEPNNTLDTSPSGIPPHAVEIVVLGGSESDIATVIMDYIFATPTYDDPELGVEIHGIDYNGNQQTFYITRPEGLTVNVSVSYTNKAGAALTTEDEELLKSRLTDLINATYMNKTLYKSDICNLLTTGMMQTYALDSVTVEVDDVEITSSYKCSSREYLTVGTIDFEETV